MLDNEINFSRLSDIQLIGIYGKWIKELKKREIIRTNNIVGEIGEHLGIKHYNETKGLPKLQAAPTSTKSVDAISNKGDRYTIKTITNRTTSVFYGINSPDSIEKQEKLFEYVMIIILNKNYCIDKILELTWDLFLKHKHWHSRMEAWNLIVSEKLINDSKIIYSRT